LLYTPDYPKQPLRPWIKFVFDPNTTGPALLAERFKALREPWKLFPLSEKQKLKVEFYREHAEWQTRVTEWESKQTAEGLKQFRMSRLRRYRESRSKREAASGKPPRPLRPKTPFFVFFNDYRKDPTNYDHAPGTRPGKNRLQIKAGVRWRELSEAEREPYVIRSAKEKEEYLERIAEWEALGETV